MRQVTGQAFADFLRALGSPILGMKQVHTDRYCVNGDAQNGSELRARMVILELPMARERSRVGIFEPRLVDGVQRRAERVGVMRRYRSSESNHPLARKPANRIDGVPRRKE